jgi:hypothetical protein
MERRKEKEREREGVQERVGGRERALYTKPDKSFRLCL